MLEPVVSLIGIAVCAVIVILLYQISDSGTSSDEIWPIPIYFIFAACGLYFLVRFVKWAWFTPIPFIGH